MLSASKSAVDRVEGHQPDSAAGEAERWDPVARFGLAAERSDLGATAAR